MSSTTVVVRDRGTRRGHRMRPAAAGGRAALRLLLPLFALAACGGDEPAGPDPVPDPIPTSLAVTPASVSVGIGATQQLTVTVLDQFGESMTPPPAGYVPQFSSSDTTRVTIDGAGVARGVRTGSATIRVTAGALEKTVTATVLPPSLQLETARTVSGEIGRAGGTLETTSTAGIRYRVEVPPLALLEPTTISMTPVAGLGNAPFVSLVGAVRFAPNGLRFLQPATLTIELPGAPDPTRLTGLAFADDGSGFTLQPHTASGAAITLLVPHFSGVGAGNLAEDAFVPPPEEDDPNVIAVFALAEENSKPGGPDVDALITILRRWYQDGIRPGLQAAAEDPSTSLHNALSDWRFWLSMLIGWSAGMNAQILEALGAEIDEARDLAATALGSRISDSNAECIGASDWVLGLPAFGLQSLAEEYGLATQDNGLDRDSFLESFCFQVGYALAELPETIEPDEAVALQIKAGLKYAGGPVEDFTAPLRTAVTATGASVDPAALKLGDDGTGTVIVTPTGGGFTITLHTCLDIDTQPASMLQPSSICADTTLTHGPQGTVVYENDFETAAGPQWTVQTIETAPSGERFLGTFSTAEARLTLGGLPAHESVTVELDLYIIDDWNGSERNPDLIEFRSGTITLLRTTFSTNQNDRQAYPDPHPALNPAGTGAFAFNALGYPPPDEDHTWRDASYRITFTIPHTANTFDFRVLGMPTSSTEIWGIDNIRVTVK